MIIHPVNFIRTLPKTKITASKAIKPRRTAEKYLPSFLKTNSIINKAKKKSTDQNLDRAFYLFFRMSVLTAYAILRNELRSICCCEYALVMMISF